MASGAVEDLVAIVLPAKTNINLYVGDNVAYFLCISCDGTHYASLPTSQS